MLVLNFGHSFTTTQHDQLVSLLGLHPKVHDIRVKIDRQQPLGIVASQLVASVSLSRQEWQSIQFVVNPLGLTALALAIVAAIHGHCGYFPPILNVRAMEGTSKPQFEVAEIVSLQVLREQVRRQGT